MAKDSFYDGFWEADIHALGVEAHERHRESSIASSWESLVPNVMTMLWWQIFK